MSDTIVFSILDHIEKLEPAKEKGRYICPACGEDNLTISTNGAYRCWNECPSADIREAIAPWEEKVKEGDRDRASLPRPVIRRKQPPKPNPAAWPSGNIWLLRLAEPATDAPQPSKPQFIPNSVLGNVPETSRETLTETIFDYGFGRQVHRFDWVDADKPKGRAKTFRQSHLEEGQRKWNKGKNQWDAYRLDEVIKILRQRWQDDVVPVLLVQEGEGCVELARAIGLASISQQGSNWNDNENGWTIGQLRAAHPNLAIVFLQDGDKTGRDKAEKYADTCATHQIPYILLSPSDFCEDLPEKADIKEILEKMTGDDFIKRLEEEIHRAVQARQQAPREEEQERSLPPGAGDEEPQEKAPGSFTPDAEFTQKCLEILYSDGPCICVNDTLYKWEGTHYGHSPDALELRRISNFCNGYAVETEQGIRYPYAKPSKVREAFDWVKMRLAVDPKSINPPGLNCLNGVIEISFDLAGNPSWQLTPHDPNRHLYLFEPLIEYKPDANPEHCDRLLEALDAPYREIFLRTIAASLDMASVRRFKGRAVKALLLKGDGNNGKDSLREIVSLMYGHSALTSVPIEAFQQADNGRLFPVARLEHSRVNWPSENKNAALDKLQSLKIAITGDRSFVIERKGKDDYEVAINAAFLFNWNDSPRLSAAQEAIKSRFAVLPFSKSFVVKPDPSKGELKADPRFKYDPQFVREEVAPAFLNRVLSALALLMAEGINYEAAEETLDAIRGEASHLWQFVKEAGLKFHPGGKVYAGEIWERLKEWYIATGTLEIEQTDRGKEKLIWYDLPNRFDRLCKAANQVPARVGEIFPKAKKGRDKGGTYLSNLVWGYDGPDSNGGSDGNGPTPPSGTPSPSGDANCLTSEAPGDAVTLTLQGSDASDAIFQSDAKNFDDTSEQYLEEPEEKSLEEGSDFASLASLPCAVSDTASPGASAVASPVEETASLSDCDPDLAQPEEGGVCLPDTEVTLPAGHSESPADESDIIVPSAKELAKLEVKFAADNLEWIAQQAEEEGREALNRLYSSDYSRQELQKAAALLQQRNPEAYSIIVRWGAEAAEAAAADTEPADTEADTEPAAAEAEPTFTADEIQILAIACQLLSPNKQARSEIVDAVRERGQSVEWAGEPVEAPATKSAESIAPGSGPISDRERDTKRALEALTTARNFKDLARAIRESRELLPWLSANHLDLEARLRIWKIVRNWLDGKVHPQFTLPF